MPGVGIEGPNRVSLGKNSRIAIGGGANDIATATFIRFVTGTVDAAAPSADASDNMSGGFVERTRSNRGMSVAIDFLWRQADNPLGQKPGFDEGQDTPRVIIWPDFLNDPNQYFKMPIGYCEGASVTVAGNGDVRGSVRLSNNGVYYTPTRKDPAGVFG